MPPGSSIRWPAGGGARARPDLLASGDGDEVAGYFGREKARLLWLRGGLWGKGDDWWPPRVGGLDGEK
jgi:hypothetical protein